MKILHVIAHMDPKQGGVSQAVRTMIRGLNESGCTNMIVSLDDPDASFLQTETIPVVALGPGKGPWCYSTALLPWLHANLVRFHLVIVHGLWLFPSFSVRKALQHLAGKQKTGRGTGVVPPCFLMPHGMLDPYFQHAKERRLKRIRNLLYWKLVEEKVVKDMDGLLFTCEEERNAAKKTFALYRPRKEIVVGLGVETPPRYGLHMKKEFLKECDKLPSRPFILFLGRIDSKKGVSELLEAYLSLLSKSTSVNQVPSLNDSGIPQLVIAGPGFDGIYGRKIKQFIEDSGQLKNHVICTDMLTGPAKWGAFYGCEAFILPSHQENFGIAVVEALACAKPVLISNKVNIWREIASAEAGIIEEDTVQGTCLLLQRFISMKMEQKDGMASHAADLYKNSFNVKAAAERLLNLVPVSFPLPTSN